MSEPIVMVPTHPGWWWRYDDLTGTYSEVFVQRVHRAGWYVVDPAAIVAWTAQLCGAREFSQPEPWSRDRFIARVVERYNASNGSPVMVDYRTSNPGESDDV